MRRPASAPLASLLAAALCATLAVLGGVRAAADNSRWGANYFPNVTLTTQDGTPVRFYDDLIKGKIVAINLIYTTCKYSCPLETARLAQVQKFLGDRMGKDLFFYSITIDPEHDTPAVLKEYAETYHAGPGWLFLTGKADDIEAISKKLGLYMRPNPANKDGHMPTLLIGNEATGQWVRNSALDNPRFIANMIGNWMNSWKTAKAAGNYASAAPLALDPGSYGFGRHCAPCHSIGEGARIGPDLAGVTKARDREWLARFIASPQALLEEGDPTAVALFEQYKPLQMPSLNLSAREAGAILDYIEARSASPGDAASPAPVPPPPTPGPPVPTPAPSTASPRPKTSGFNAVDVTPLVAPYLRIQEALSADTLSGVTSAARAIAGNSAVAGPAGEPIRASSLKLAASKDLARARAAFGTLGDALMAAAAVSGASLEEGVKVAYCPMVKKYWLQRGEEIRNPFHGKAMLDCGRLVAEMPGQRVQLLGEKR
ncbi:MAG: DUF3347 domain-containing protein [Acidobacteria bacterium]|nr:MAG: DUF3347 domain-containing protein [Acidobacteriota bacterium]